MLDVGKVERGTSNSLVGPLKEPAADVWTPRIGRLMRLINLLEAVVLTAEASFWLM
jgi:hypothetical protein